ncbi:LacI family DNA-binding transcriptional regulator [Streptomyces telluris]|uniref:LacI family DNA-binding transcriptional regulator n=1 Tax=Streptomyces telluris TaxID=2720021 RepID=A0A9X2RNS1_9ACTN|nr:LacI family DNA-binding transcriptional regulator [Streptomyces telluris]MCQ8772274.1 LacI family DNA-binding transcriptional regulator [Streptomyces telluris]NJP75726.1 LacI family DNA-binding transcriptional regulator [Streptomyces telluris]
MGYGEKLKGYYRARYWEAPGVLRTLVDAEGRTMRFSSKRAAAKAANDQEAVIRGAAKSSPPPEKPTAPSEEAVNGGDPPSAAPAESDVQPGMTFGEYVNRWYAELELAASTMQNYKRHVENHLLPAFGEKALSAITRSDVGAWEKKERASYEGTSVQTWHGTLHVIFEDAVEEGLLDANPAARRRGRGKRAGRSRRRGPEKVVTDALGILLVSERMALLSGRDDEFVGGLTKGYTGARWGELVGLEPAFCRPNSIRVEWQLYELDNGELHRCPPKDDSYRTIDSMGWLSALIAGQIARVDPRPCPCHGRRYVFRGYGEANDAARSPGVKLIDVARHAGVSIGTASNVLNRPEAVREEKRGKVEIAMAELGYVRGAAPGEPAAHWRRSGFATWLFQPAATGWYPKKAPQEARPVPLLGDPWPGVPARGRNASERAEACWVPIAPGLTPHGLRHTHKAIMEDMGTPPKLMDERLGHLDGSVQARYSHITSGMRRRLMEGLTEVWEASLDARRAMCPRSQVAALDELLRDRTP